MALVRHCADYWLSAEALSIRIARVSDSAGIAVITGYAQQLLTALIVTTKTWDARVERAGVLVIALQIVRGVHAFTRTSRT